MHIKDAFASAKLLQAASPATLAMLASYAGLRRAPRGEHLFYDKEEVRTLYILVEGMAALYKCIGAGEKKVVFVYGPGNALNEVIVNGLPASINCEILQDAQLLCFPIDRMLQAMEQDFGLAKAYMDSMSLKIRRLYRQMKNTSNSIRGDKRIAAKLWKLSQDYGEPCPGGTRIAMELTITYLADMLGSKRETVSRQLKQLADVGLVRYEDGRFLLPDRDALQKYFKES